MNPCKKAPYANEQVAITAILKIRLFSTRQIKPVRAYLCKCGSWHLTSFKLTDDAKNTIDNLNQQITKLKKQQEELNQKYLVEQQQTRKKLNERNKKLNKQKEVIKLNELLNKKDKTIKMLRETVSDLIYKLNRKEIIS